MERGGDVRPEGGEGGKETGTEVSGNGQKSCLTSSALVELWLKWRTRQFHQ